jgi:hypothetical protein
VDRLGYESGGDAGESHDRAPDARSDAAGDVEAHALQRNRIRKGGPWNQIGNGRLRGGSVESGSAADQER